MLTKYLDGLREMRARDPDLPLYRLLRRVLAWRLWQLVGGRPVVALHGRSRLRLEARRSERGIPGAIYIYRDGFEPSVRHAIDRYVPSGACCYDIGANLGLWTLRLAERVGPLGRVHAFEPMAANLRLLHESVALSGAGNIRVEPFALGQNEGLADLFVPEDVGRSSLAPESAGDSRQQVLVRRLDEVWVAHGRPQVAFVKMDVEGAEPLVLAGGSSFFASVRPVTCCEINPRKLRNMGSTAEAVLAPFAAWGYDAMAWDSCERALHRFDPRTLSGDGLHDLVFVPRPRPSEREANLN